MDGRVHLVHDVTGLAAIDGACHKICLKKCLYWPLLQLLMTQPGNHVSALGEQGSVDGALDKQLSPPPFAPPSLEKKS